MFRTFQTLDNATEASILNQEQELQETFAKTFFFGALANED